MIKKILIFFIQKTIKFLTFLLFKLNAELIAYSFSNGKDLKSDFTLRKNTYY